MTTAHQRLPSVHVLTSGFAGATTQIPNAVHAIANAFKPMVSSQSNTAPQILPDTQNSRAYIQDVSSSEHSQPSSPHIERRIPHLPPIESPEYQGRESERSETLNQHQVIPNICLCPQVARVPRPRNAFILYRQHHHAAVVAEHPGKTNPEISKIIGEQWRQLSPEEKAVWQKLGDEEKKSHLERFPDYRYQPRRNVKRGSSALDPQIPQSPTVCSKCHGQSPGHRVNVNSLSTPNAYTSTTLSSDSSMSKSPTLIPSISQNSPPGASYGSSKNLPPIRPLLQDEIERKEVPSIDSTLPRPLYSTRTHSQDDARQGVEALLSLGTTTLTPSPELASAVPVQQPPQPTSISSIINTTSPVIKTDSYKQNDFSLSPLSRTGEFSDMKQSSRFQLPAISSISSRMKVDSKSCNPYSSCTLSVFEKLDVIFEVSHSIKVADRRGALISVDGNSECVRQVTSALAKRLDGLSVYDISAMDSHVKSDADRISLSQETKEIVRAVEVHKNMSRLIPHIESRSIILEKYIYSLATGSAISIMGSEESAHEVVENRSRPSMSGNSNWKWCANLYRGIVTPDLTIIISDEEKNVQKRVFSNGAKVLVVPGIEFMSTVVREVQDIMNCFN
ncbi:hypothetical protein V1511DRAFT_509189 [Dipodascopsis uninucleata]